MKLEISFKNKLQSTFQVWWLQVTYMIVSSGFVSLLYVYFVKSKLNFGYILLAEALGYGGSVLFILLKRQFHIRRSLQLGFLLVLMALLSLFLPLSPLFVLIVYTILRISGVIMIFVPYNILFFGSTKENKKLHKMTTYWAIGSIVGIIAPVTGGYIFSRLGLNIFIGIALGILLLALYLTTFVQMEIYRYTVKEILIHLKGLRTITMLDGALDTVSNILITLYLLTFIKGEFNFGAILSVIALVSVFLSFEVAKFSDKYNKRVEFIWPLSVLAAIIMISFYFVSSFWVVITLVILFKFVSTLFNPIRSNIVLDKTNTSAITWISRDLYLNIGRSAVLFLLCIVLYRGFLKESFIVLGVLFIALPFIIFKKRIYSKIEL